jgi:3-phenylpropionate/trans-cinnamate dioxygenase ferredoxin reductase subunit
VAEPTDVAEPTEAGEAAGRTTVHYLRTLADAAVLRERLVPGSRLLVVGGGWIGMEVAATARQAEVEVTLVEPAEHPLLNALGPELGARLAEVHRRHGVDLRTSTGFERLTDGRAVLGDGTELEVDTVLIGIGAIPNDALAHAAGLGLSNGILVDAGLRSSHHDVLAAGDVANHQHPLFDDRLRVEHWQNAISQGSTAAHVLLGEQVVYDELPFFFSDQYDLGLEYFGHPGPDAEVRIEPADDADGLTAWWHTGDKLVAAMHINQWDRSEELAERVRAGR